MTRLGGQINFWGKLQRLGEPVDHYPTVGQVTTGGYSTPHIFADEPQEIDAVIRPFGENVPHLEREGTTGETSEYRLYADADAGVKRNDRIHWNGIPYRVTNPDYDQLEHVDRFRLREDEREFVQEADVVLGDEEITEPDNDHPSGVE